MHKNYNDAHMQGMLISKYWFEFRQSSYGSQHRGKRTITKITLKSSSKYGTKPLKTIRESDNCVYGSGVLYIRRQWPFVNMV